MKTVYITLTLKQAHWLLKLVDALHVAFGADTPLELQAVRNKLWDSLKE